MKTLFRLFILLFFLVPAVAVGATPSSLRIAEHELTHHLALKVASALAPAANTFYYLGEELTFHDRKVEAEAANRREAVELREQKAKALEGLDL